ncbi:MAG: hypothetical protein WC107_02910 [Patescibacteria group bacterium]
MKRVITKIILFCAILFSPAIAFAASNPEVENFTHDAMTALIGLASVAVVFFLVRGGYLYITSTGNPAALDEAKRTIRNALIGLIIVIGAFVFSSMLNSAMTQPANNATGTALNMSPIEPVESDNSLAQVIIDAIFGFLQNIIQSATKPVLDGITWFLTSTPSLASNSVVFNFWLVMVGITDSLFAIIIALLGFRVMSGSTFGLEEVSLKDLWPKVALAFVGANTSIFLIDWVIQLCQTLVNSILNATGGLGTAWILNAFDPASFLSGTTALITLIFVIIFIILAAVLLLFYISRLMILAFGAVISPLVCAIALIPSMADFAANLTKAYFITIFTVFIHVVIIQLASAFLTVPGQVGANPVISILIGIALFSILLKSTGTAIQLALMSGSSNMMKKLGGQIMNVISVSNAKNTTVVKETVKRGASAR